MSTGTDEIDRPGKPPRVGAVTKDTLVPLGGALFIAMTIYSNVTQYEAARKTKDDVVLARISALEAENARLVDAIETARRNLWTCTDHERFAERLAFANPSMRLPARHKRCQADDLVDEK